MTISDVERRLVLAAYEMGWRNACFDHMSQQQDPTYPIGLSKRGNASNVIEELDPNNLLGLVEAS